MTALTFAALATAGDAHLPTNGMTFIDSNKVTAAFAKGNAATGEQ